MPKGKSTAAGGGFQRGFLLSKPKKKKEKKLPQTVAAAVVVHDDVTAESSATVTPIQRPKPASSALLGLEEGEENISQTTPSPSSLLFNVGEINESQGKKSRPSKSPFVVLDICSGNTAIDDDDDDDDSNDETNGDQFGLTEVSSSTIRRKKGSFISEVLPTNSSLVSGDNQSDHVVETVPAAPSSQNPMFDSSTLSLANALDEDTNPSASDSAVNPPSKEDTAANFLHCQQDLDRTLWKLRRKRRRKDATEGDSDNDWRRIASSFCANLVGSNTNAIVNVNQELLSWVWNSLLIACPKKSSQCFAEMRLGLVLLESTRNPLAWKVFSSMLSPSADKRHRISTLGAVTVLDLWCVNQQKQQQQQEPNKAISTTWLNDLLRSVLAPLGQQVRGQSTRTILAQRCLTGIYSVMATSVDHVLGEHTDCVDASRKALSDTLWQVYNDVLVTAWDTQITWTTSVNSKDGHGNEQRVARNACTRAVLQTWKELSGELITSCDKDRAFVDFCRLLRGAKLDDSELWIGGLRQTLLKSELDWREQDALVYLTRSLDCGKEFFASANKTLAKGKDDQVILLQGVVAWLGQRKNLHIENHQEFFELSSTLVLYSMSGSTVKLVLAILDLLWVNSNGFPPETNAATQSELPNSVGFWIQLLGKFDMHNNIQDSASKRPLLQISQLAICQLLAHCLVKLSCTAELSLSVKVFIESLVSQNGMTASTTTVLILILKLLRGKSVKAAHLQMFAHSIEGGDTQHQILSAYLSHDLLFEQLHSNAAVKDLIRLEQEQGFDPVSCGPIDTMVSSNVHLLAALVVADPSDSGVYILVSSLTTSLRKTMSIDKTAIKAFIEQVVTALVKLIDEKNKLPPQLSTLLESNHAKAIESTCSLLGDSWRQSFGTGLELDTTHFGNLLSCAASVMFQYPASTVPLTLLGAVVGDGIYFSPEKLASLTAPREKAPQKSPVTFFVVTALLETVIDELDTQRKRDEEDSDPAGSKNSEGEAIFGRLAPLLLLRRIPANLFQNTFNEFADVKDVSDFDLRQLLHRLANHLAVRLDIMLISAEASASTRAFSPEERQLAAEVAGRCLPFNEHVDATIGAFSCFQSICVSSFSDILAVMSCDGSSLGENDVLTRSKIRRARAALYATCHFIPFTKICKTELVDDALLSVASFCLRCMNADQGIFESPNLEKDFLQLQSGCIEFFAVCVEQSLSLRSTEPLKQIIDSKSGGAFRMVYSTLVEIVCTGRIAQKEHQSWLEAARARISLNGYSIAENKETAASTYSVPCCTCLWNSLIVVAQRRPEENSKPRFLAESILPWLVSWGGAALKNAGNSPNGQVKHQHAICITAALQLSFILVTRSKSFGGLPSIAAATAVALSFQIFDDCPASVQALHRWALVAIQDGKGASDYAGEALRCAGLKVLLAVVTIDQINDDASLSRGGLVFSPKEAQGIFSTLKDVAKYDPEPKLKALASHILKAIGH